LLEPKHPTHYAFTRSLGGKTLIVVGNFSSVPLELPLAVAGELVSGNLVIGNYGEMPDVAGVPR
jgi:oligo-1,6-glucosidase